MGELIVKGDGVKGPGERVRDATEMTGGVVERVLSDSEVARLN